MSLPVPFPGETIFSIVTRIFMRSGAKSLNSVLLRMGSRDRRALVSPFGNCIRGLYDAFPSLAAVVEPSDIVWRHTTSPLLIAFSQRHANGDQRQAFSSAVVERGGWANSPRTCRALLPQGLRACVECLRQDTAERGVAYWHREHQVKPVAHCWRHGVHLMEYHWRPGVGFEFELPGFGRYGDGAFDVASPLPHNKLLGPWLARTFSTLLASSCNDRDHLRSALIQAAHEQKLTIGVRPRLKRVWDLMVDTYGSNFLHALKYPTIYSTHVASRYVRPLQATSSAVDPVIAVLLAGALGVQLGEQRGPPPQNHIRSDEASRYTIADKDLVDALDAAGYVLHRAANALRISRHRLIGRIINAGLTCPIVLGSNSKHSENAIRMMICALADGESRENVSRRFDCNSSFIDQLAIYEPKLRTTLKQQRYERTLRSNRQTVLDYIKRPEATRGQLWKKLPGPMSFLGRHDPVWLKDQRAKIGRLRRVSPRPAAGYGRVSDNELDLRIEAQLRAVVPAMRALQPPRRLTPSLAMNLAGVGMTVFSKINAGRLPRTRALLEEIKEDEAMFVARRLQYAFARLVKVRRTLTLTSLRLASGLRVAKLESHRATVQELAAQWGLPFSSRAAPRLTANASSNC